MADILEQGKVTRNIENGIATIEFFHPLSNSLPGKLLAEVAETITEMGNNDSVTVIVLKSAGERAFCAGASFDELISINDIETGKVFFSGFANVINACRKCPKLIIGRVQGKAVGGGVGVKDLAYFLGSCLSSEELETYERSLVDYYFGELLEKVPEEIGELLEKEWRNLYLLAWADFNRFLLGWMPEHQKLHGFALAKNEEALQIIQNKKADT